MTRRDKPLSNWVASVRPRDDTHLERYRHALVLVREEHRRRLDERNEMSGLIDRRYLNDYYSEE